MTFAERVSRSEGPRGNRGPLLPRECIYDRALVKRWKKKRLSPSSLFRFPDVSLPTLPSERVSLLSHSSFKLLPIIIESMGGHYNTICAFQQSYFLYALG